MNAHLFCTVYSVKKVFIPAHIRKQNQGALATVIYGYFGSEMKPKTAQTSWISLCLILYIVKVKLQRRILKITGRFKKLHATVSPPPSDDLMKKEFLL